MVNWYWVMAYYVVMETVEGGEVPIDGGVRGGCGTAGSKLAGRDGSGCL